MVRVLLVVGFVALIAYAVMPWQEGKSGFQRLTQALVNRLDAKYNELVLQDDLNDMADKASYCTKNEDCVVILCGKKINEHSFSINKYYDRDDLSLVCEEEDGQAVWDGYAECKKGVCGVSRLTGE